MADCCTANGKRKAAYDLAVIGAGSAGFSAAITAAEQGAQVALIGHGTIGGTCVNVGCVPSKTMIRATEALHGAHATGRFPGLVGEARVVDWGRLVEAKDELVSTLRQKKYIDLLPDYNGIAYLEGPARLTEGGVAINGTVLRAPKIILASGARPAMPPIPGIEDVDCLTSTSLLDLRELPESLIVVGGGFIGCELAQMLARAGVAVTIVCRSRLLPAAEPEIAEALVRILLGEGIELQCGIAYEFCRRDEGGVTLCVRQGGKLTELRAERVMVATGRIPNVEGLGLAQAGVQQTGNGSIVVDDRMRTTRAGVYAAGDVTGRDQFVYMAAYGARIAALNALQGDGLVYDDFAMPWIVFTDPQVAGVGLTEAAAATAGFEAKTSIVGLDQVPRALAARATRGLIKLVADARTDRLLGAQILAPEGADSIQTMVLALKHGMTAKSLGETIFPYLTTVEGFKLAAQGFAKDVTKLSCCAG
jgi:mercuric reductase